MSSLLKVSVNLKTHPKAYHPEVGDVVQCALDFALTPGSAVTTLNVVLDRPNLTKIGVANTSDKPIMGSSQISAFFYAAEEGLCHLRLTPFMGSQPGPEHAITILVGQAHDGGPSAGSKRGNA